MKTHREKLIESMEEMVRTTLQESDFNGCHFEVFLQKGLSKILNEAKEHSRRFGLLRVFIAENLTDTQLSLSMAAQLVPMNIHGFCRWFKVMSGGLTFVEYVTQVRIKRAQRLLLETDLRIKEIPSESGFLSLTHFNRTFKKVVGQAPQEYRIAHRAAPLLKRDMVAA
jgi:AraC-like DNA-binding protein